MDGEHIFYAIKNTSDGLLLVNTHGYLIIKLFREAARVLCESLNKEEEIRNKIMPYVVVKVKVNEL